MDLQPVSSHKLETLWFKPVQIPFKPNYEILIYCISVKSGILCVELSWIESISEVECNQDQIIK